MIITNTLFSGYGIIMSIWQGQRPAFLKKYFCLSSRIWEIHFTTLHWINIVSSLLAIFLFQMKWTILQIQCHSCVGKGLFISQLSEWLFIITIKNEINVNIDCLLRKIETAILSSLCLFVCREGVPYLGNWTKHHVFVASGL